MASFRRLKAIFVPSGVKAGLSSITSQSAPQTAAVRSRWSPSSVASASQMCLLAREPSMFATRVKVIEAPSGDHCGWASDRAGSSPGSAPVTSPVATSTTKTRLAGPSAPPGDCRVNAMNRPSGDQLGSVSQSAGPRSDSGIGAASLPSALASQIRSTRTTVDGLEPGHRDPRAVR